MNKIELKEYINNIIDGLNDSDIYNLYMHRGISKKIIDGGRIERYSDKTSVITLFINTNNNIEKQILDIIKNLIQE